MQQLRMNGMALTMALVLLACAVAAQEVVSFKGPDGKYGLADADGKVVVEPKYNEVYKFWEGFAIVSTDHGCTFINRRGEEVIPVRYRSITSFSNGLAVATTMRTTKADGMFFVIDTTGRSLTGEEALHNRPFFTDGLALAKFDQGWNYMDRKGKRLTNIYYDRADRFYEGVAVVKKAGKYAMIDDKGKMLVPFEYPHLTRMSQGLIAFLEMGMLNDSAYGYMDRNGQVVIKPQYYRAGSFAANGLAGVCPLGGECGYIDKKGNVAIRFQFNSVYPFIGETAEVERGKRKFHIDRNGKEVVAPVKFTIKPDDYKEGMAVMEDPETGKYGYKNKKGKEVIPCIYDEAYKFNNGLAAVKSKGFFGAVNKEGDVIIPLKYEKISTLAHGLVPVQYQGKWYYFDVGGHAKGFAVGGYDRANPLNEGMGLVCKDNRYGYVDSTSREVIPLQYTRAHPFSQGLAAVLMPEKGKYGYIDRTGATVIAPKYDEAGLFDKEGKAKVTIGKNEFYIDRNGKKVKH